MSSHDFSDLSQRALASMWSRVEAHQKIQTLLEANLPRAFRGHVQVALIERDSLVLCTDSPLWAADLRYRSKALLDHVNAHLSVNLKRCRIHVRPDVFFSTLPPGPARN